MKCPACTSEIVAEGQSCPSCGASLDDSYAETRILPVDSKPRSGRRTPTHTRANSVHTTSDALDHSRFISGTILNSRYRIVGLLGRGGMGEVYRAEDLTLGQPVALKFLPEALSADTAALTRFLREVRVARQISHRNVCRVYDIGEAEGQQFLSMEFVRGEELSSVLKRFGRLPADKATEIARQLCAGLAAAHEAGVLHRDLKPSNVMIDEKGDVRVTDFGLADLLEEFGQGAALEGTPEYMSPEQLAGRELNERSDIYSLGLVLYELYTGRKAFTAPTLSELLRLRKTESMPERASAIVRDIDPLVERVVERCLAPDPQQRPATALAVANALPGGDPLAAALAAGETPSPEMVAAAPKQGSLRPAVALALAGGALLLFALCFALSGRIYLHRRVPFEKSVEALRDRASEVARGFGYESATDSASGFYANAEYMNHVQQNDPSAARWERLRTGHPAGIIFWYRQSPRYLTALSPEGVTQLDPPRTVSGMAQVTLDTRGRLLAFDGVPPQTVQPQEPKPAPFDWPRLFAEAGLDPATFKKVEPVWVPPHAFDERAAWEGTYPGQPDAVLRVEAAAFRGRPVYFQLVNPWNQARRQEEVVIPAASRVFLAVTTVIFCSVMLGAALLARHNLRLGRGDRRGAGRLAAFVFAGMLLEWLLTAHHVPSLMDEFENFLLNLSGCLLVSGIMWLIYIALEPYVRRRWPGRIVSWSRLLAGGWRDPLVGRDLLVGALAGCAIILLTFGRAIAAPWLGAPPPRPDAIFMRGLLGMQYTFGSTAAQALNSLLFASVLMFLLLLLTIITRREWVGVALLWVLVSGFFFGSGNVALDVAFGGVAAAATLFVLLRFGMLALVFTEFFLLFFSTYPLTTDFNAWYAGLAAFGAAVGVALILYGLKTSLAGQPLLRHSLLGD
ncbi:MAG: serine/threonine protein kinase [Acidobacteria bacterium]|nr:serine/threonine protein kinase [Acidobacteriota bacterium]MBV9927515.1 serine/threonine protein kinase [Acidobacteriota bacterium]